MARPNRDGSLDLKLWHERLGHVSKKQIIATEKSQCVRGLRLLDTGSTDGGLSIQADRVDCESCVMGKLTRKTFPDSERIRASEVGERLHADIGGPVGAKAIGGSEYYLILKDES